MLRKIFLIFVLVLFISKISFAGLTTYELVGVVKSNNHGAVVNGVKASLSKNFKVVASTNPAGDKNLTVLIVEDKAFFDAIDKAGRYAFFAVPLKVGIQQVKDVNKIIFANPVYEVAAFAKGKDKLIKVASKVKKELEASLLNIKNLEAKKKNFGYSTDEDEIGNWQMMGQSLYTISRMGDKKFKTIDDALKALDSSLSNHKNGWTKVYEIKLAKAVIVGVSNPKYEKEAFDIGGYDHLCAFPINIVIMDKGGISAWTLPEMYRMSLYFMDAGMGAFAAHMSMPGEIDDSLNGLLK